MPSQAYGGLLEESIYGLSKPEELLKCDGHAKLLWAHKWISPSARFPWNPGYLGTG